jgi:hypothetical protein
MRNGNSAAIAPHPAASEGSAYRLPAVAALCMLPEQGIRDRIFSGVLEAHQDTKLRWHISYASAQALRVARVYEVGSTFGLQIGHPLVAKCADDPACSVPDARRRFEQNARSEEAERLSARRAVKLRGELNGGHR